MNSEQYPWEFFDNSLFVLKIRAPGRRLREKAEAEKRRVQYEFRKSGNVNAFALEYGSQDCDLQVLAESAALYDSTAREVWSIKGRAVTPAFVRMIFERLVLPLLAARRSTIEAEFQLKALRTRMNGSLSIPVCRRLDMKVRELREELWEKYEIEAKTLAIKIIASAAPKNASERPEPNSVPLPPAESLNRARAKTVAKVIEELNVLKPLIFGPGDYIDLRPKFPDFVTFEMTEKHPELKEKLVHFQDHSRRYFRFAQEIAAAYHGRKLATIQTDWKRFKPAEFKGKPLKKPVRSKRR